MAVAGILSENNPNASSFIDELNENIQACRDSYPPPLTRSNSSETLIPMQNLSSGNGIHSVRILTNNYSNHHNGLAMNMNQQQQQQQQQLQQQQQAAMAGTVAFPKLSAAISSTSSINSSVSSYASTTSSRHNASSAFPMPAPIGAGALGGYSMVAAQPGVGGAGTTMGSLGISSQLQSQGQQTLMTNGLPQQQQQVPLTFAPHLATATNNTITTTSTSLNTSLAGLGPLLQPNSLALAASGALLGGTGCSVPEFLYQLTKMLTDPNRDIIEWSTYSGNGRIEVHHPARLEKEVLGRYFRHSKYSSFQRQLNYFGFRKIAGKGKMSPCSYVNEAATMDIRSLLLMKRKNSKEKERELQLERERKEREEGGSGGGSGVGGTVGGGMKRANPGDDIKPATVQPMFNINTTNSVALAVPQPSASINAMAGNVANIAVNNISNSNDVPLSNASTIMNNVAVVGRHQHPIQLQSTNGLSSTAATPSDSSLHPNKRAKPNPATNASDGRGYTVAVGKGVRHQLNGYLRANIGVTANTPAASSHSSISTSMPTTSSSTSDNKKYHPSYLSHPAAKQASSAPAPLQFLDPSELGMSIENSLSQLKDNFALATAGGGNSGGGAGSSSVNGASTVTAATTMATSSSLASGSLSLAASVMAANNNNNNINNATNHTTNNHRHNDHQSSSNDQSGIIKYAPSALTRRVSDANFLGRLLSRDDSLINLAMLPTLDHDATAVAASSSAGNDGINGVDGDGSSDQQPDYMASIFSRDDSLINLAAAVEMSSPLLAPVAPEGNVNDGSKQESDETASGDGSNDTFGFIDFQT